MATTVTWDRLRELARFRAQNGCAISLYLDLDPSVTPTPGDAATRVNALIDEIERSEAARGPELAHAQKEGLRKDVARLRTFFENEFDREGSHGFAVFCAHLDNLWRPLALSERVPDVVKVGRSLYLAPLVPLVGRGEGALVAVVSRERGDVYRLRASRLEEVAENSQDQPGRHDQGGWSQARYQRHIEKLVHDHLKDVAETLDRQVRELGSPPLVVVAAEETRAELEETLSNEVKKAIVGWTSADAHAGPAELLEDVQPLQGGARRWRRPPMDASSCSCSRTEPTGRRGSARPADGSQAKAAPVRSTAPRWRSGPRASTSPCTRRLPTEARSWPCASARISSLSRASARSCASERRPPARPR
jgi:peptide chain release factor subunit 1